MWGPVVSESDLISQFFLRAVSGAVALVVGTGLCYRLFIGGYLRKLEHYKERLRVYKDLDKRSAKIVLNVDILRGKPEWIDFFSQESQAFNEYVNGEDRLFMSGALRAHCQRITRTLEELMPDQYPEPPSKVDYPEPRLLNVDSQFKSLRRLIEDEIEATYFEVPPGVIKWWAGVKRRLPL